MVEKVILKALAKDPEDRFDDAQRFGSKLEAALKSNEEANNNTAIASATAFVTLDDDAFQMADSLQEETLQIVNHSKSQ